MIKKPKYGFVNHIAIWLSILFLISFSMSDKSGFISSFLDISVDGVFYLFIIYFNIYYLFPNYLKGQSLGKYAFFLIISVILITPIKGLVMYLINSNDVNSRREVLFNLHYTFLSAFLVAGASTMVKILVEWIIYQRDKKKIENENLQSELKFLKNQINPHFLFNTLNNVYALALIKSEKTPEIILKLSELLRYMLYECNEAKVKLSDEINYIKNYIDLERLRQKADTTIELNVDGEISDQTITPLLFTPFLENAFKHGVNKVLENPCVKISILVACDDLSFIISNSKPEFKDSMIKNSQGGIGLVNVTKRLELLYQGNYSLEIVNTTTKYEIELHLKLI